MDKKITTRDEAARTVATPDQLPPHHLYDEKVVQASLGDFIADIVQWLYRKAKEKLSGRSGAQQSVILCVDNEQMIQVAMAEYIQKQGCTHVAAMNSREAYDAIAKRLPSLILLDIHMPGDDTLALLKSFKSDPKTADIPVVIVTGMDDIGLIASYLDAGADDYFLKSYHPAQLQKQIAPLMAHAAPGGELTQPAETTSLALTDQATARDIANALILLNGSEQKLINGLDHQDLNPSLRHDLKNVLFCIQAAKKIIGESFDL